MRVDATLSALTPPASPITGPAQGDLALSFEQLLQEVHAQGQERAFGFSELGVIRPGPANATPQAPTTAESTMDAVPEGAETPTQARGPAPMETTTSGASSPYPGRSDAPSGKNFPEISSTRSHATPASRQTIVSFEQTPTLRPTRAGQSSAAKAPARRLPQEGQSKRFSLVVSEQDGTVQIIAGAPQLSAEAKERLRKAAARLAAELGMTLGDFTINGALVDAPAPPTGAPDGDFPG